MKGPRVSRTPRWSHDQYVVRTVSACCPVRHLPEGFPSWEAVSPRREEGAVLLLADLGKRAGRRLQGIRDKPEPMDIVGWDSRGRHHHADARRGFEEGASERTRRGIVNLMRKMVHLCSKERTIGGFVLS